MTFLYSFGVLVYSLIIRCLSIVNPKAKLWYHGRKHLDLEGLKKFKGCILIQCSSLGEFEQGKPLINAIREKYPHKSIVLSFFSPSGYEPKKNIDIVDKVIYLPIDTKRKAKEFTRVLEPEMAFFIKYDFWPNLYNALKVLDCKIYLVSAIFRPNQVFFKWYGGWYRRTLKLVDYFFIQNETSKQLLESINITNFEITGDTRFDQVLSIQSESFDDKIINTFINPNDNIVVAGSTWVQDEKLLIKCIEKYPNWKWIIAPHEITNSHIKEITQLFTNINISFYSKGIQDINPNSQVLVVDTIGILKYLYRYANIAYVGGGFGKGIHNTLEPAVYGIPVLFGPKHQKFQEAQDLLLEQIGHEVNEDNIMSIFNSIQQLEKRELIRNKTKNYIAKQKGAITKIMNYLT